MSSGTEAFAQGVSPGHVVMKDAGDDPANRRQESRFEIGVQGALCVMDDAPGRQGHAPVLVHDVSRQGLKLSTRIPLRRGERALVRFALPGRPARTRTVAIRWVQRVGGQFEVGAEATEWHGHGHDDLHDEVPVSPSDSYFEAVGDFIDEDPPAPELDDVPSHPPAGQVAAAYTPMEEPRQAAPLPVKSDGHGVGAAGPRATILEARVAEETLPRSWMEVLALTLIVLSVGSIGWLVLSWRHLSN